MKQPNQYSNIDLRFVSEEHQEECPKCGDRGRRVVSERIIWKENKLVQTARCSRCKHRYISVEAYAKRAV